MLDSLKERVSRITSFHFTAKSGPGSKMHWNGHAKGSVSITSDGKSVTFFETGLFYANTSAKPLKQKNVYRWEFCENHISVYQERRDTPVFLVKLIEEGNAWKSQKDHHCGNDFYSLLMKIKDNEISATWTIHGPKKEELLEYVYM